MEALDSPPQTNLQIIDKNNSDSLYDNKGKEENYINETEAANRELECDEDEKVAHQNNTNLELQKQKLILYNNLEDEEIEKQNTTPCRKESVESTLTTTEEEEHSASLKDVDSSFEKQDIFDNKIEDAKLDDSINNEVSDAEKDAEDEISKRSSEAENAENSFHTNDSETSIDKTFSDSDTPGDISLKEPVGAAMTPTLDIFATKQPLIVAGETSLVLRSDYENDTESHAINLKSYSEESNSAEIRICSPRLNGNHKEANDSTCDSPEQENKVGEHGLEIDKSESVSMTYPTKEEAAEHQQTVTHDVKNPTEENNIKTTDDQIGTFETRLKLNNESRCSTPESLCSSSTAYSSSSQQLVIDQPDEKVSPLRLTIKKKQSQSKTKKQSNIPKKSVTNNRKIRNLKSPDLPILQNVDKIESHDENTVQFSTTETVAQSSSLSTSSLNETQYMNDVFTADTIMLPQDSPKAQTEELLIESKAAYSHCDCHKEVAVSPNSHLHTCPAYKSIAPNYYKCASCGTYHENWSFFLHIREQHDRFLCLYCIKSFPTAEKLSLHLEIKHDLEQNHFNSEESFRSSAASLNGYALETRFLMCCTCQHVFGERVAFTEHICMEYMKSCVLCGQKGRHTNQCKAHPFVKRRNKKKVKEKKSLEALPATSSSLIDVQEETPTESEPISLNPITHNEDSNSSSNMVIDESCTTNHTLSGKINSFNAIEEPEFAEELHETPQEPSTPQHAIEEPVDNENINVLKFKLRVPKEFQKPVDAVISSSESDDGICEEEIMDERNQNASHSLVSSQQLENLNSVGEINAEQLCRSESNESTASATEGNPSKTECDDESENDEDANPYLQRILKEIEQTKLDIKRTKETIHSSHSLKPDGTAIEDDSNYTSDHADKKNTTEESPKRHWTPTPPASPKNIVNNAENEHVEEHSTPMELDINEDSKVVEETPNGEAEMENSPPQMQSDQPCLEANLDNVDDSASVEPIPNENETQTTDANIDAFSENISKEQPPPPSDGIEIANEDSLLIELQLDRPMEKYEVVEFVRTCLKAAYPYCLYCNHARRIAVNGESLVLHILAQHRFSATVDSITAEELQPDTIVAKLKSLLPELRNEYFNTSSYCTIGAGAFTRHFNERIFECFQCRFVTTTHKELYLHNRKMHLRTAILCFMCRCNFFSFSEILCHICPGVPHKVSIFEIKFRCCLCDLDNIPSPFRLMVHLRKRHFACDICLEDCRDQSKLSSHVWKHKLHHLCYRCGIAYRNKMDITKHLFWKHGTESAICKRCLNKRWPHVYHFCVPPQTFVCDVCQHCFTKAMYLTVHKRIHLADFRYPCTDENCEEKFISRKLLLKHAITHQALEKAGLIENSNNTSEPPAVDIDLSKPVLKEEHLDGTVTDPQKMQPDESEAKIDEQIKQELEPNQQNQSEALEETKPAPPNAENESIATKPQKKKKKKRAKESLEDLNLTAPNLSESGSSSESESETKSKYGEEESKVELSPHSENGDAKEQKPSEMEEVENPGNVLDIWKNFLQAQQASGADVEAPSINDLEEDFAAPPKTLHVCYSDHDYCKMFYPNQSSPNKRGSKTKSGGERKRTHSSLKRSSSRNSNAASSSSSDESSDTSSSSSCSCGSNCSCSGGSSSSSSSSSSENSDSSAASRKRQRKKSERNSRHRKSESISPRKNHNMSEAINATEMGEKPSLQGVQEPTNSADMERPDSLSESCINESDLETVESETDEEYYDEHPQKLASEILSQKRAQLMARTFLSPSHNFDIVENSRPSTPSLPEDVVYEKRKKKKKRERKSTSKSNILPPKFQINADAPQHPQHSHLEVNLAANSIQHRQQLEAMQNQYFALGDNTTQATTSSLQQMPANMIELPMSQPNLSQHGTPRISEGSSCSDVDGSLKRSKRARRPNKFYGYTSDDESMGSSFLGQSVLIGMRAFKPQPPPQLVWHKEDLPTPSKSILNSKKSIRAQKRHEKDSYGLSAPDSDGAHGSLPKKKKTSSLLQSLSRKRSKKLPPIPRLKIRPALFGVGNTAKVFKNDSSQDMQEDTDQFASSLHDADDSSDVSSEDGRNQAWKDLIQPSKTQPEQYQVPEASQHKSKKSSLQAVREPLPPTPQTTVFNHKIPPALLPNPDFATLQYFKANNIRYPIRPPAGARAAREGESVYCYCRCPYDEVSEMIACDGDNCLIEWFHFECVGIMVAPQGKWFCAECRPQYSEDLYPSSVTPNVIGNIREH